MSSPSFQVQPTITVPLADTAVNPVVPPGQTGTPPPPLGPLAAFTGVFVNKPGTVGFNEIFRPQNPITPTPLPIPVPGSNNILEVNLTMETLQFSAPLGSVPNRAEASPPTLAPQPDIFLNGVDYLQQINDVTNPLTPVGIHNEPGQWVHVPALNNPLEVESVFRQASIPHGVTLCAPGTFSTAAGPPVIPPVNLGDATPPSGITPFVVGTGPGTDTPAQLVRFASQTVTATGTARLPQTLPPQITQQVLDDPNTLLRQALANQQIISTTTIFIATEADFVLGPFPFFGGGLSQIDFLFGSAAAAADTDTDTTDENAFVDSMRAAFYIETVLAKNGRDTYTQIQYTQQIRLEFAGLYWPHVSVNTLVPQSFPPGQLI
jgi:hypothetical protein